MIAEVARSFHGRVSDFAALVSVLLIFVTVLTQQRTGLLHRMADDIPLRQAIWNAVANSAILLGTAGIALAGAHLWLTAVRGWTPLPRDVDEQAKAIITLTGIFFLYLLLWQAYLVVEAAKKIKRDPSATTT